MQNQNINESNLPVSKGWMNYVRALRKFDWLVAIISVVIIAGCIYYVKQLGIRSDFKEMLPRDAKSVVELDKIEKRTRSVGNFVVLVGGGAPWEDMKRFIDDFTAAAKTDLQDVTDRVDYNADNVKNYYDKNKYLYVDLDDLREIYRRLKRQIDYEKISKTPFFVELGEEKPKFEIKDVEDKYKSKAGNYLDYREGYFTNPEATLAAVLLKSFSGATDVKASEHLIGRVQSVVDRLNPSSYHPDLKVAFGGRYQKVVQEYQTIIADILKTTIICIVLVALVVFLYFKRVRMVFLMTLTAGIGTLATLALAKFYIGYLTTQTAFLSSIIVGNGINYGLIIMARYIEERRENHSVAYSIERCLSQTWKATVTSSITTSAAFAVLALTHVRGFSQFGMIGGVGMFLCWVSSYIFLPAWLSLTERIWPLKTMASRLDFSVMGHVADWVIRHQRRILIGSSTALILALLSMVWYLPNSLEYNFDNLRYKPIQETEGWHTWARDQTNSIFGQSTTPSIILAESIEDVEPICDEIRAKAKVLGEDLLDACKNLFTYVPTDQPAKLQILSDVRELLSGSTLNFLTDDQKKEVDKFRETFNLQELKVEDIPSEITVNFEERDGSVGLIDYVYPKPTTNLWDGKDLMRFAEMIREVDLPDGRKIYSSGEPVIFADLLSIIVHEGPIITLVSFILVVFLVLLNFRFSKESTLVVIALSVGVVWMVGSMALFGLKLNFFNFVALPISFGIGVDYAVNIIQRYQLEGGNIRKSIAKTGGAVILCSLTTIIGYFALILSRNRALNSFGYVSILGELFCLFAAIVTLPTIVLWWKRRKEKAIDMADVAERAV